jgi:NAD(P)-dependent dehydrogenase (short-subunit alcohol dehydrogenase family)
VNKMTDRDWQHVLDINLSGAFFMAQAALDHMLERGTGRIINVSSVIGEIGNIGQANYAASKSGLFGLTKTLPGLGRLVLRHRADLGRQRRPGHVTAASSGPALGDRRPLLGKLPNCLI